MAFAPSCVQRAHARHGGPTMAEQQALEESILLRFILAGCRGMGGKASVSEIEGRWQPRSRKRGYNGGSAGCSYNGDSIDGKLSRNASSSSFLCLIIGRGR